MKKELTFICVPVLVNRKPVGGLIIIDARKTTRGNRQRAAKLLSTTERIIGYKVKIHEIDCNRFRT